MAKTTVAGSAHLHLRMCAFGGLFTVLSVTFAPMAAFGLTVLACLVLSQM
jgi:hypothetical protein